MKRFLYFLTLSFFFTGCNLSGENVDYGCEYTFSIMNTTDKTVVSRVVDYGVAERNVTIGPGQEHYIYSTGEMCGENYIPDMGGLYFLNAVELSVDGQILGFFKSDKYWTCSAEPYKAHYRMVITDEVLRELLDNEE